MGQKPFYGRGAFLDDTGRLLRLWTDPVPADDAETCLHARDDCCAKPTGADPSNAGRRG